MCPLTIGFFDECTVRVNACSPLGLQFSQSQDIFQAIESHLNYFGVHECEKVTQRFYTAKLHEVPGGEWSRENYVPATGLHTCYLSSYSDTFCFVGRISPNLFCRTPWGGVGDSPGCFLPCAKLCNLQDCDERLQEICIYYHLKTKKSSIILIHMVI